MFYFFWKLYVPALCSHRQSSWSSFVHFQYVPIAGDCLWNIFKSLILNIVIIYAHMNFIASFFFSQDWFYSSLSSFDVCYKCLIFNKTVCFCYFYETSFILYMSTALTWLLCEHSYHFDSCPCRKWYERDIRNLLLLLLLL